MTDAIVKNFKKIRKIINVINEKIVKINNN